MSAQTSHWTNMHASARDLARSSAPAVRSVLQSLGSDFEETPHDPMRIWYRCKDRGNTVQLKRTSIVVGGRRPRLAVEHLDLALSDGRVSRPHAHLARCRWSILDRGPGKRQRDASEQGAHRWAREARPWRPAHPRGDHPASHCSEDAPKARSLGWHILACASPVGRWKALSVKWHMLGEVFTEVGLDATGSCRTVPESGGAGDFQQGPGSTIHVPGAAALSSGAPMHRQRIWERSMSRTTRRSGA